MLCISLLRCIVLTSSVCGYCSFLSVMRKLDSLHWQRWSLNSWQSTKQTWLMTQQTAPWTKMQRVVASQTDNYNAGTISRQYKPVPFISPVVLFQRCLQCLMSTVLMPPVLWRCWFGGRKGIRPVKKTWVVGCWCGYLSGVRCRLAYGPADATATYCLLLQ